MTKRAPLPYAVPDRARPAEAPKGFESLGAYPRIRMRRNRADAWNRALVAEHRLSAADLIWPVFLQEEDGSFPIPSMPGVDRLGLGPLVDAVGEARALGIPAVALFPATQIERKTEDGDAVYVFGRNTELLVVHQPDCPLAAALEARAAR